MQLNIDRETWTLTEHFTGLEWGGWGDCELVWTSPTGDTAHFQWDGGPVWTLEGHGVEGLAVKAATLAEAVAAFDVEVDLMERDREERAALEAWCESRRGSLVGSEAGFYGYGG